MLFFIDFKWIFFSLVQECRGTEQPNFGATQSRSRHPGQHSQVHWTKLWGKGKPDLRHHRVNYCVSIDQHPPDQTYSRQPRQLSTGRPGRPIVLCKAAQFRWIGVQQHHKIRLSIQTETRPDVRKSSSFPMCPVSGMISIVVTMTTWSYWIFIVLAQRILHSRQGDQSREVPIPGRVPQLFLNRIPLFDFWLVQFIGSFCYLTCRHPLLLCRVLSFEYRFKKIVMKYLCIRRGLRNACYNLWAILWGFS